MKIALILISSLLLIVSADTLLQIQILATAGSQYPEKSLFSSLNISKSENGVITAVGIRQHYLLGQWLYNNFNKKYNLSATYEPNNILVRAQKKDVSIQSAQSNMYGMFPLGTGPDLMNTSISPQLLYPPLMDETFPSFGANSTPNNFNFIPIYSRKPEFDHILQPLALEACSLNKQKYQDNKQKQLYKVVENQYSPMLQNISTLVGENIAFDQLGLLNQNLQYSQGIQQQLPGFTQSLIDKVALVQLIEKALHRFPTKEEVDFYSNQFYQSLQNEYQVFQEYESTEENIQDRQVIVNFVDDEYMLLILTSLNLTSWKCIYNLNENYQNSQYCLNNGIPPASHLMFQFWMGEANNTYLKVLFNNQPQPFCDGETTCYYPKFQQLVNLNSANYTTQCQQTISKPISNYDIAIICVNIVNFLLICVVAYYGYLYYDTKKTIEQKGIKLS